MPQAPAQHESSAQFQVIEQIATIYLEKGSLDYYQRVSYLLPVWWSKSFSENFKEAQISQIPPEPLPQPQCSVSGLIGKNIWQFTFQPGQRQIFPGMPERYPFISISSVNTAVFESASNGATFDAIEGIEEFRKKAVEWANECSTQIGETVRCSYLNQLTSGPLDPQLARERFQNMTKIAVPSYATDFEVKSTSTVKSKVQGIEINDTSLWTSQNTILSISKWQFQKHLDIYHNGCRCDINTKIKSVVKKKDIVEVFSEVVDLGLKRVKGGLS